MNKPHQHNRIARTFRNFTLAVMVLLALALPNSSRLLSLFNVHIPTGAVLGLEISLFLMIALIYTSTSGITSLKLFLRFLLLEIPNILQIVTLSGFVAAILKPDIRAARPMLALSLMLNLAYLLAQQDEYISKLKLSEERVRELRGRFLIFNLALYGALYLLLYPVAKALLSS